MECVNNFVISVIVPVYNVEPYIRKCLDSIINQTYNNLEIILVDDGSPDKSGVICDEYAAQYSQIRVIHQQNAGLSAARNAGLDIASGDYIMFVDSDDWIEKNTCQTLLLIAQQQEADIVFYGYNEVSSSSYKILKSSKERITRMIEKEEILGDIITGKSIFRDYCWNKFYHRNLFDEIRFPEGRVYEDMGTTYKLIHLADTIYITDAVLYNYYRHDDSITGSYYSLNQTIDRVFIIQERLEFLNKFYPEFVDIQLLWLIRDLLITQDKFKDKQERVTIKDNLDVIIQAYKSRVPNLAKCSKMVWIYYYFPILMKPFLRLRGLYLSLKIGTV